MQYMKLNAIQREELLASLSGMSDYLREVFSGLCPEQARMPAPDGVFSPVEQVWHLADLERDGFGVRIERLLHERQPLLPDFDGTRVAIERNYSSLPLEAGLAAFEDARRRNIEVFRCLKAEAWRRSGFQEGVGPVSLCDIPSFMMQHDAAHRTEIETWRAYAAT